MRLAIGTTIRAQALLFDMDGTLLDSHVPLERITHRWAAMHGIDGQAMLALSHGRRTIDTVTAVATPGMDIAAEAAWITREETIDVAGITALPGALAFLATLPNDRWAVVTSAGRELALARMAAAGITAPPVLVSAEDVRTGKPDPEGYLLAAGRLGFAAADCLVLEDAPAGLLAGRNSGARTLALATTLGPDQLAGQEWLPDYLGLAVSREPRGAVLLTVTG